MPTDKRSATKPALIKAQQETPSKEVSSQMPCENASACAITQVCGEKKWNVKDVDQHLMGCEKRKQKQSKGNKKQETCKQRCENYVQVLGAS